MSIEMINCIKQRIYIIWKNKIDFHKSLILSFKYVKKTKNIRMRIFEIIQFLSLDVSITKKFYSIEAKFSSARVQYFWHFLTYCDVINVEHSSHEKGGKKEEKNDRSNKDNVNFHLRYRKVKRERSSNALMYHRSMSINPSRFSTNSSHVW